ncbi:unnamed protein product, partial [Polarella glacialis]
ELTFEQVLAEEQEVLRRRRSEPGCGVSANSLEPGTRFSIALSGGGIRAAAFQAGVLWRLAEEGLLQDVQYLAAVSGGGYIAASFASHLVAEEVDNTQDVRGWYLDIVAKTLCRMQHNAGGFIRDPVGADGTWRWRETLAFPTNGSGVLPRIFDTPIFLLTLCMTLATNPAQFCIIYLVPAIEILNLYFGAALRFSFCAPGSTDSWQILFEWSSFGVILRAFEVTAAVNFVVFLSSRLPFFALGSPGKDGIHPGSRRYQLIHGLLACLSRCIALMFTMIVLLYALPAAQGWYLSDTMAANQPRGALCEKYSAWAASSDSHDNIGCADIHQGQAWYETYVTMSSPFNGTIPQINGTEPLRAETNTFKGSDSTTNGWKRNPDLFIYTWIVEIVQDEKRSIITSFVCVLFVLFVTGTVLAPIIPGFLFLVLSLAGPAISLVIIFLLAHWRIYGPITGQTLLYKRWAFSAQIWNDFVRFSLFAGIFLVPFYNELRRLWHWYYLRSLQMNFFCRGEDLPMGRLLEATRGPLLILTGTVSDFKRLGTQRSISEIFFSCLHTGSHLTGFARTPYFRTLAKCTALTGAGSLDALSLSMSNRMRFRFWLEFLNLSWGDYILFERAETCSFGRLPPAWLKRFTDSLRPWIRRKFTWVLQQLPVLGLWVVMQVLLAIGWHQAKASGSRDCSSAKTMVLIAFWLFGGIFILSFFAFLPSLHFLMASHVIRQWHQASRFIYRDTRGPCLLYVTDGGVQDCTGIVQLMRRRCERILLVLAAADPRDELAVLRTAMEHAADQKLGCFFDPSGDHRDLQILLEAYAEDKAKPYLHLRIRYGWGGLPHSRDQEFGDLFVVKNRSIPELHSIPVPPLLTEDKIKGRLDMTAQEVGEWRLAKDLGGLGCCDSCHHCCNCGPKFPHLTGTNYLWLTPTLFSSLCRLGRAVSGEAIHALAGKTAAQEQLKGLECNQQFLVQPPPPAQQMDQMVGQLIVQL